MTMTRETAEAKAERLVLTGAVEWVDDAEYVVRGDTGSYRVLDGNCPCTAFSYRDACSHSRAVELSEADREKEADEIRARIAELREELAGLEKYLYETTTSPDELRREREEAERRERRRAEEAARMESDEFDFSLE